MVKEEGKRMYRKEGTTERIDENVQIGQKNKDSGIKTTKVVLLKHRALSTRHLYQAYPGFIFELKQLNR